MPDSPNHSNRSALFAELVSLPAPQLEQVIVALNAPRGNIPTAAAQPASRVAALFEWVEILQYFKIVEVLGLGSSAIARTVIGTTFV